jgi:hypothetical protein
MKKFTSIALLFVFGALLVGCGGEKVEESKPVSAGNGPKEPVPMGATGGGAAPAPTGNATSAGKATAN